MTRVFAPLPGRRARAFADDLATVLDILNPSGSPTVPPPSSEPTDAAVPLAAASGSPGLVAASPSAPGQTVTALARGDGARRRVRTLHHGSADIGLSS